MVKRSLLLFLAVVATIGVLPGSALAAEEDAWEFDGGGWGHGIGLSQFGAYGMARHDGKSASQILAHYYQGTSVEQFPSSSWVFDDKAIHVGLEQALTSVSLGAIGNPLDVCQPADTCAKSFQISPGEDWKFETTPDDPTKCRFRHVEVGNEGPGACTATITWTDDNGATRLKVGTKEYAHGTLHFVNSGSSFHVVLATGLEDYLYGLAEMPSSWGVNGVEALKAQAIIGRGYAIATSLARGGSQGTGRLSSCACHIRDDSRDQVFNGWAKENEVSGGVTYGKTYWQPAVNSTAGLVVTHQDSTATGNIISAYYSSSTGGHTENNEDVWGGNGVSWLRSQPDPWGANSSHNPLARWTVYVTAQDLASALGWSEVLTATVLEGPPGTVVKFTGKKNGSTVSVEKTGNEIRGILGSHGFKVDGSSVRTSPYIIAVLPPYHFIDISSSVFRNAIVELWRQNITSGCNPPANDRYCPNDAVTRGQMAVFLARALSLPSTSKDFFDDDNGSVYEGAINKIAAAGITQGCNPPANDRFCAGRSVTRGEMAAFLSRGFKLPPANGDTFTDDDNSIFEGAIEKIAAAKITLGCNPPSNTRYCPKEAVTRGQMAAFLIRALSR